ncbi:hypothetical protein PR048_001426 [Dryococelus australis]|uniref:Uncharacterized protein n=1 Tax=Dryococelus australis TaxID=614101 RepID=A0ABQ9IHG2_9NEOP|nr:hypothetical protein PR048_001426 [Dryococelus australis]
MLLKNAKDVDLGYATLFSLRVKEKEVLQFRQQCQTCLQFLVAKLLERSPLKCHLTEFLSFLNPYNVHYDILLNSSYFLLVLFRVLTDSTDVSFLRNSHTKKDVILDDFWAFLLSRTPSAENLRQLFILSPGNAPLENGFSDNGDILVEKLKQVSVVAQCLIYDAVKKAGSLYALDITKQLLFFMRSANARWKQALDDRRSKPTAEEKAASEKRKAAMLVKELQTKALKLLLETQNELAAIDEQLKGLQK